MSEYKKNSPISVWAEDDRPREKFQNKGKSSLSNADLIAIQLGSGSKNESALELAKKILNSANEDLDILSRFSLEELTNFKGVGIAKAINILSALEIGRRRSHQVQRSKVVINNSESVSKMLLPILQDLQHEEFWVIFLNTSNRIVKIEKISQGGLDSTVVDLRVILKRALLLSSSSIILSHNHPSGSTKASQADIRLTKQISSACTSLNISVLDHIIIAGSKYFSFADEGLI